MNFLDSRLPNRFWSKCVPEPNSGCWLWIASTNRLGYGHFNPCSEDKGRSWLAYRFAYEALIGVVPSGLVLDHLCRLPCCVNPLHLEPVTVRENCRRGIKGVLTTHCPKGHPYSDANTYHTIYSNGWQSRRCKICVRTAARAKWQST